MPSKKKGKSRPVPTHQDSLRQDIEATRVSISSPDGDGGEDGEAHDDGLDIADELLATLDARDKAEQHVREANETRHEHSTSPLRQAGEKLLQVGEKMFHHHRSPSGSSMGKSPPLMPSSPPTDAASTTTTDADLASDMQRKGSIRRIFGSSPTQSSHTSQSDVLSLGGGGSGSAESGKRKVSRQQARKERKEAEMEAQRVQAREELKANGGKPDEAERERSAINELCKAMKVQMHEINPDGHCLYAAVADQLNRLGKGQSGHGKLTYVDTRKSTADYMRAHKDDFLPFISDSDEHMAGIENKEAGTQSAFMKYCDAVEKTAVWGGQPEILALSRVFHTPVHVVQAGCPVVKVGTEEGKPGDEPVVISYHRHMYGLGEHYNSLHKL